MEDLRGHFIQETVPLSEKISELVEKGRKAEEKVGTLEETFDRLKEIVNKGK
jgi:hypothetical protein